MGRSQPTVRDFIEQRRDDLGPYRRTLRRKDQPSFDRLWEHGANDAPGIKMAGLTDVDWGILFAICRRQQRELDALREQIEER